MNVIISYNGPRRDDVDLFLQNTIPGKLVGSGFLFLGGGQRDLEFDDVPWTLDEIEAQARAVCGPNFESVVDRDA